MADVSAGNSSIYSDIIENRISGMEECREDKTGTLCRSKKCRDNKENNTVYKHFVSNFLYSVINAIKKAENKEIFIGYTIFALSIISTAKRLVQTVISISLQQNSILSFSILSLLGGILFPAVAFVGLTKFDYWNYHNRKLMFFSTIPLSIVSSTAVLAAFIYGILVRPAVFMLPVSREITPSFIFNLSRLLNVVAVGMPTILFSYILFKQYKDEDNRQIIYDFKIIKYIDFRKNKKFLYDMRFISDLNTGRRYTIKMKDRSLHTYVSGASGSAKTSSCITPSVADDLDQKVHNDDYCKKQLEIMLEAGEIGINKAFDDNEFSISNFTPITDEGRRKFSELISKSQSCGITCMAPNAAFADEIYELATNRNFKVNRVDPILVNGKHKEGFVGFNPLFIPEYLTGIERELDIFKKAKLFADVLQALYELSGSSDAYFAKLNKNVTTTFTVLLEVTMPFVNPGHQVTPEDVQDVVNNFDLIKPYYYALLKNFADIDVMGANGEPVPSKLRKVNCGKYQFIVPLINNDILNEKGREQLENQIRGLRTIMSDFINNPLIHDVFCVQDSLDLDKILKDGEITVVNYALELGMVESTAFGLFFSLSFSNAVVRRPGTEKTRLPHFYYIDEFPILLHKDHEQMFTMFRQYNVSNFVAFQTLDLFDKSPMTRYLKGVVMNNTAHQIVLGRVSIDEMDKYMKMAGKEVKVIDQSTVSETSLTDSGTRMSFSTRSTPTWVNTREGGAFRYKDFQEVSVFTVDQGNPKTVFDGKVSFLPLKRRNAVPERYYVDWSRFDVICEDIRDEKPESPVIDDCISLAGKEGIFNGTDKEPIIMADGNADVTESAHQNDDMAGVKDRNPEAAYISPEKIFEKVEKEFKEKENGSEKESGHVGTADERLYAEEESEESQYRQYRMLQREEDENRRNDEESTAFVEDKVLDSDADSHSYVSFDDFFGTLDD